MSLHVTLRSERRNTVYYYTVYDHRDCVVIATTNWQLAQLHFDLCAQGHTARTLFMLAKKVRGPAARYKKTSKNR
jgi:hypothetical protein